MEIRAGCQASHNHAAEVPRKILFNDCIGKAKQNS
jgi:hypothetical protein